MWIAGICTILFSVVGFVLSYLDNTHAFRWVVVGFYFLSVFTLPTYLLFLRRAVVAVYGARIFVHIRTHREFWFILAVAAVTRFVFLETYPFVGVGDELKYGGLYAREMLEGDIDNFFEYGLHGTQGTMPLMLGIPFYLVFGESVLSYRVFAALISLSTVCILYVAALFLCNRRVAFWSAFVLAVLPLELFFARTEIVVAMNSWWGIVLFLTTLGIIRGRRKGLAWYAVYGILIGFVFTFHSTAKAFAVVSLGLVLGKVLFDGLRFLLQRRVGKKEAVRVFLFFAFFIVGFGPNLLHMNQGSLITRERSFIHNGAVENSAEEVQPGHIESIQQTGAVLGMRYITSLLVYGVEPTQSWYSVREPILPPLLFVFFLAGVVFLLLAMLLYRRPVSGLLLAYLLIIPFTHSAITTELNYEHRLAPLFPLIALATGVGMYVTFHLIHWNKVLQAALAVYLVSIGVVFFANEAAGFEGNTDYAVFEYKAMHALNALKDREDIGNVAPHMCFVVPEHEGQHYRASHVWEQFSFFLPGVRYQPVSSSGRIKAEKNELYVLEYCGKEGVVFEDYSVDCREKSLFRFPCPRGYEGELRVLIDRELGMRN